jgi:hypothetical protein
MQLTPREYLTIARGLEDHTDSTTYYVRAVIRNARTDALVDTINLVDKGDRRFTYNWQVPADTSGQGFYILITTIVYTDSGYTTKAENYGEKIEEHLVQERFNPIAHGGAGGADVSYKKIREIVKDEVSQIVFPTIPKFPEFPKLQPVLNGIAELRNDIKGIKIPEPDFDGIEFRLNSLEKEIKAIEIPETDLNPVMSQINALKEDIQPISDSVDKNNKTLSSNILSRIEILEKMIMDLKKEFSNIPFVAISPKAREQKKEEINYEELLK